MEAHTFIPVLIFFIVLAAVIGWIPGRIARERDHPQATAIMVCGIVGVFTVLFWFVALIWAFTNDTNEYKHNPRIKFRKRYTR